MVEQETAFEVQQTETIKEGVFVAFPPSVDITPGMTVRNTTREEEQPRFIVINVVRPLGRDPAMLLPWAQGEDFRKGDLVAVDPGRTADGDLLFQTSTAAWFAAGRGVVVGGVAQGTIAKGDKLVLCNEDGRYLPCRCEFIEREDDGSGRPAQPGESVGILLSLDCEEQREASRTGNPENLLRAVSAYPSLHKPSRRLARAAVNPTESALPTAQHRRRSPPVDCDCFSSRRVPELHPEPQNTECDAWHRLLELVDHAAATGATEFVPAHDMDWESYSRIVTLPASITKLKSVKLLALYGSNLDRVPPEIAEMESLEFFDVYTSYRLHWYPYEITRCPNLKASRMSTRALFGNYKNRQHFPRLDDDLDSLPLVTPAECSVCRSPLDSKVVRRWISLRIGTDVVPLLVNACSMSCIESLPNPPDHYVSFPHAGGADVQQPPTRF